MWGDIKRVERQYILPISNGKIIADIAIWHTDGTGTFIEVKKLILIEIILFQLFPKFYFME